MAVKPTAVVTVASLTPLRVLFDGSSTPVAARNYGLTVSVGQRVQVQLGPAPTAPLITDVLTAAPSDAGATLLNFGGEDAIVAVDFDIGDVITANNAGDSFVPTGWSLIGGDSSIYTVADGGISVDFAAYGGGSAIGIYTVLSTGGVTTDKFLTVHAYNSSCLQSIAAPAFPTSYSGDFGVTVGCLVGLLSETEQVGSGFALPFNFKVAVSDPTASATGTVTLQTNLFSVVPATVYVDSV